MCGIVGIFSHAPVAVELYDSLIHLQHRGQDAAGILTANERFYLKHGKGLVKEIFSTEDIATLQGQIGIAHTRYPTAGGNTETDIQPLWLGSPRGIALAHNGNLTNYQELHHEICYEKHRHLNTSLDSEALLHVIADELTDFNQADEQQFFQYLTQVFEKVFTRLQGSYSVVSIIIGKGLIAFRDPHGIRPLVWGERVNEDGSKDYIFASETTVFYALGFEHKGDLQPGEIAYVNQSGQLFRKVVSKRALNPCVFEYVYFARPDSTLDSVSVYRSRLRMGQNLAKRWMSVFKDLLPDVVIPAPFTANTAALSFAHELGVRYSEGLYKNAFIGRTFIMPNQKTRSKQVRYKLTPQKTEIENKVVLIVDDSIVRGTTSREIVKMVREVGAKKIYFVSTCPPISYPCFYGIDIPSEKELIAAKGIARVKEYLKVDEILFQEIDDLVEAVTRRGDHSIKRPCLGCLDGQYVCGKITPQKKEELSKIRMNSKRE